MVVAYFLIDITTNNSTMRLKPEDSGRKVTCRINGTQINYGELYYCSKERMYYIFQNKINGACPQSLSPKDKEYECSWAYRSLLKDRFSPVVTEFEFKEEENSASLSDDVSGMMAVAFAKWLRDNTVADGAPKLLLKSDIKRYTIEELYDLYTLIAM